MNVFLTNFLISIDNSSLILYLAENVFFKVRQEMYGHLPQMINARYTVPT